MSFNFGTLLKGALSIIGAEASKALEAEKPTLEAAATTLLASGIKVVATAATNTLAKSPLGAQGAALGAVLNAETPAAESAANGVAVKLVDEGVDGAAKLLEKDFPPAS